MHLIPKQRLRQAGLDEGAVWDPRVWRWGCRRHHQALDGPAGPRLGLEDQPASVISFAREHGLEWFGDRDGWRKVER